MATPFGGMCSKSSSPKIEIHVFSQLFIMMMEPTNPSAALPVSTETTVDIVVVAGSVKVAVCTAVTVDPPVPCPGMTRFLMAT